MLTLLARADWIHDTIKHSLRLRRLRRLKRTQGLRGQLINLWDGFQGWLLVTIVGFVTACIAFSIIRAEMWLFDLKEGYCADGWTKAKRFCCREEGAPEKALGAFVLRGWAASATEEGGECEAWTTWVDVWRKWTGEGEGAGEAASYIAYIAIAVRVSSALASPADTDADCCPRQLVFAVLASALTIYFTASTSVYSSKDSPASPRLADTTQFANSPDLSASPPVSTSKYGAVDRVVSAATSEASLDTSLQGHSEPAAVSRTRKTLYYVSGRNGPALSLLLARRSRIAPPVPARPPAQVSPKSRPSSPASSSAATSAPGPSASNPLASRSRSPRASRSAKKARSSTSPRASPTSSRGSGASTTGTRARGGRC